MNNDFNKRYLEARRKVIETDFAGLNPMQRKAVMATEGALLILAGAGSGKTTVLINRIANLMRYGKAGDSEEIPENASVEDICLKSALCSAKSVSFRSPKREMGP